MTPTWNGVADPLKSAPTEVFEVVVGGLLWLPTAAPAAFAAVVPLTGESVVELRTGGGLTPTGPVVVVGGTALVTLAEFPVCCADGGLSDVSVDVVGGAEGSALAALATP